MLSNQRPQSWVRMPDQLFEVAIGHSNMRPKSMKISPTCLTQLGRDVRGRLSNQTKVGLHKHPYSLPLLHISHMSYRLIGEWQSDRCSSGGEALKHLSLGGLCCR